MYRTRIGEKFTEGARLSWLGMLKKKWSIAELARRIGKDRGTVYHWLFGDNKPGLDGVLAFERVLKVPPKSWALDPVRPFEPPGESAA